MSNQDVLSHVATMPLSNRIALVETILKSIKAEIVETAQQRQADHKKDLIRRRKEFKVKAYHLGRDILVDRDEIYAERGL